MKKNVLFLVALILSVNVSCQNSEKLSNYFPNLNNKDTIISSEQLINSYGYNELDTIIALKYFFDNDADKMHDIGVATNQEDPTEVYYTPYTKKIYPLYKIKIKNTDIYLLCYGKTGFFVYLSFYDYIEDKILNTFTAIDYSDDYKNEYTYSTIFPNNYIATVRYYEKAYYVLSRIDYEAKNFIEVKKVEINKTL